MGQNENNQLGKVICYGIGLLILYELLVTLLPYILALLAAIGAGYLFYEYEKHNRRH